MCIRDRNELNAFVKDMFREQIRQLREDKMLIRLYRWELSVNNPIVEQIRRKREENGIKLIEFISRISGVPFSQIQFLATMISSSITCLLYTSYWHRARSGFCSVSSRLLQPL